MLGNLISDLLCPECCDKTLYMDTDTSKRKGLASYVMIKCVCGYSRGEFTSPVIQKDGKRSGGQAFDVNYRSVYAMRACGLGLSGLEKCCGMMNMPQPLTKNLYHAVSTKLKDAAKVIAEGSMSAAVIEAVKEESKTGIEVSVDCTWQKRGFSSLNGVVAAISTSNFKVLDVETMWRICEARVLKEKLRKQWSNGKPIMNLSVMRTMRDLQGGMEAFGSLQIFTRSIQKHGVRYIKYYGDGDSKSFEKVRDIYPDSIIIVIIIVFKSIIMPCKHGLDCSCSGKSPLCTILGNLSSESFYT